MVMLMMNLMMMTMMMMMVMMMVVTMMVMVVMVVGNGGMQRVTGVTITRDWLTHGSCGALEIEGSSSIFALTGSAYILHTGWFLFFCARVYRNSKTWVG